VATFDAQLSSQIASADKRWLAKIRDTDKQHGTCSEADVVRLALRMARPLVDRMGPQERLRLYSAMRRGE